MVYHKQFKQLRKASAHRASASSCLFRISLALCSILAMESGVVDSLCFNTISVHLRSQHGNNHKKMYHHITQQPASANLCANENLHRSPSISLRMSAFNHQSNTICNRYGKSTRYPHRPKQSSLSFGLSGSKKSGTILDRNALGSPSSLQLSANDKANATNGTSTKSSNQTSNNVSSTLETSPENANPNKWQADDFENDYQLLKTAMARQSAMTDLQQQQRKHILDFGFARNRRPLVQDLLQTIVKIGVLMLLLKSGGAGNGMDWAIETWKSQLTWWRKLHIFGAHTIVAMTTIHHWIVGTALPLLFLTLIKSEKLGPSARRLEEYFTSKGQSSPDAPSFFYTTEISRKRSKDKDTGDHVLCLLENWSSATIGVCACGFYSMLVSLRRQMMGNPIYVGGFISNINVCARLFTRLGVAAALHQYPSLLFELRRNDQPRPLCQTTTYMQQAVKGLLRWLPLGVASDLALLYGTRRGILSEATTGAIVASSLSILAPFCHLFALRRIVRFSKCSAVSLSEATSFPTDQGRRTRGDNRETVKWRYQLRWRTPQRIGETMRSWSNYFFTGHVPLLLEMDDWKSQPIRFDDFSTEGTHFSLNKRGRRKGSKDATMEQSDSDDSIPNADAIVESLSLIFRDRDAALLNATQARLAKHQESYDTKALNDVLGVAVQQTFNIGLSYDFDHFDSPGDGEEVSIHQLRARMAKSAVRRKRELDNAMEKELDVLRRLKDNVVTDINREEAEKEMKSVEHGIRERNAKEVDRMKNALCVLIPTHADAPKGTEQYESPIMVAEYVNLSAPVERRGELKASVGSVSDSESLSQVEEYVRRDFGDEAADVYRKEEIAARLKEKELLSRFRQRYGELKEDESSQSESTRGDIGGIDDGSDAAGDGDLDSVL